MGDTPQLDETCRVFGAIEPSGSLMRFVVGEDSAPRVMDPDQIRSELGDPFATLLLLNGQFPRSGAEVFAELSAATTDGDPLRSQTSFLLGEGGQVSGDDIQSTNRGLRFLVSTGGEEGPDVVVSASHPSVGLVELMAWDRSKGGFNYYRTLGDEGQWVWAGNSRHALSAPTKGKGPFESHPSGNVLMKELRFPWVNWHSFAANIFEDAFPNGDERRTHPWFVNRRGADICEETVAKPSIRRWTKVRLDSAFGTDGKIEDPARIMEQVLTSPTVNLITSKTESAAASARGAVDLPQTFFIDSEAFTEVLGLDPPPPFAVSPGLYSSNLGRFEFVLTDGGGFRRAGDTHFAFVVPERAFEDNELLRQVIDRKLLIPRLAAALLTVDFPNPVFSAKRASLMQHVPDTATVTGEGSTFSEQMATNIVNAAPGTPEGSAEKAFAELWSAGEGWPAAFNERLQSYYASVLERLQTQEGYDDCVRLAESRRNRVRGMPIFESRLLFPETNAPPAELSMRPDGTVAES